MTFEDKGEKQMREVTSINLHKHNPNLTFVLLCFPCFHNPSNPQCCFQIQTYFNFSSVLKM